MRSAIQIGKIYAGGRHGERRQITGVEAGRVEFKVLTGWRAGGDDGFSVQIETFVRWIRFIVDPETGAITPFDGRGEPGKPHPRTIAAARLDVIRCARTTREAVEDLAALVHGWRKRTRETADLGPEAVVDLPDGRVPIDTTVELPGARVRLRVKIVEGGAE